MTDFEAKWLSPRPKFQPRKITIILLRKSFDEFKQQGIVLKENEVAIIDMSDGSKITVIGDGKTLAVDCKRIDFPYTEIISTIEDDRYVARFVEASKGVNNETI